MNFQSALITVIIIMGLVFIPLSSRGEAGENASNPLAAVNNTDLRWQYFDLDGPDRNDFYLDGSYMLFPKLKL